MGDDDEGDSGVQDYLSVIESSAMDSKKTERTEQQGAAAAAAAAETRRDPRRGPSEAHTHTGTAQAFFSSLKRLPITTTVIGGARTHGPAAP